MSDNKLGSIVLRMFRQKMNTADIAKTLRMPEHEIAKVLTKAREEDREFDDIAKVSAVPQSSVEDGKR